MLRTLFLQGPSFDGFDGGAGARYQAKREIRSFWYPTWLAQPAALVPGSKLIDAPAHDLSWDDIAHEADSHDLVILHTSTPSFSQDVRTAELLKERNPRLLIGFAAETEDVVANARAKRERKGADWIVANDVSGDRGDSVMGGDHNRAHIVTAQGVETLERMAKTDLARTLVARIASHLETVETE